MREHAQIAFEQLITQCHRDIAPHLKSLMPHWLMAQNDTYALVASSAKKALYTAFNDDKHKEAMAFCRTEVMQVILVSHLYCSINYLLLAFLYIFKKNYMQHVCHI